MCRGSGGFRVSVLFHCANCVATLLGLFHNFSIGFVFLLNNVVATNLTYRIWQLSSISLTFDVVDRPLG